jgi:hypothetical protein
MLAAAVVDIGMMLFSAILSAGIHSAMVMFAVAGVLPVLAIAMACAMRGADSTSFETTV